MSARAPSVTFVIMAGGKGERLWPLVRAAILVCRADKTQAVREVVRRVSADRRLAPYR